MLTIWNLSTAENSVSGNIYKKLFYEDGKSAELDSSSFILLKFRIKNDPLGRDMVRDYVLTVKGRTIAPDKHPENSASLNLSDENPGNDLPDNYLLQQNFPNPFNPETVINYSIPAAGHVILKVYDILGKELVTLTDQFQTEGSYSITFSGKNLSSGVYYYKITARGFCRN